MLSEEAVVLLQNYRWPGNIRQLKNITEQMSVIEQSRDMGTAELKQYLPADQGSQLPMVIGEKRKMPLIFLSVRSCTSCFLR